MSAPIRLSDERGAVIQTNGVGNPYSGHINWTVTLADAWGVSDVKPRRVSVSTKAKAAPRVYAPREAPKVKYAGKELFCLVSFDGRYLHQSCEGLTNDERYAWLGSERQLERVRSIYPQTSDMIATEIVK